MGGPIVFGPFTFDPEARELRRNGNTVRLQDQPAQVLGALLERHGHLVTREELQHLLWPDGTFVDYDQSLNKAVTKLRDALHDDADRPRYIETIPRRGYRFIAPVKRAEPAALPISSQGRPNAQRRALLAGVTVGLAALAAAAVWLMLANRPSPIASIAVLPFVNLTGNPQFDPEADALTEALISRLAQTPGFDRVISRTSVLRFKSTQLSLPEIAKELQVDAIVEGALVQAGDRVKATVRLIHARQEKPIWTDTYERPAAEVQALQSEAALEVVANASRRLAAADRRRVGRFRAIHPGAHAAYVRGAPMCGHWLNADWASGVALLEEALRLEPNYPEALAALAFCKWHQVNKGGRTPSEGCPAARSAALQAAELDPDLPEAHAALTIVKLSCDWDWRGADESSRRAVQLSPYMGMPAYVRTIYLMVMGRAVEAAALARKAIESEPGAAFPAQTLAVSLMLANRLDDAVHEFQAVTRADPGNAWPYFQKAFVLTRLGRMDEARREWTIGRSILPPGKNYAADYWAMPYQFASGDRKGAAEITAAWEARSEREWVDPFVLADMYAAQNDIDRAFDRLEKAYLVRSPAIFWLKSEAILSPLRSDPRFPALLKKMNFPE